MEIKEKYLRKYWESIVADQTEEMYESEGYKVTREVSLEDNMRADMVIEKDGRKTIVEILSRHKNSRAITALKNWARSYGYEFKLIYANYSPIEREFEFEDFCYLFTDYLNENHPSEFEEFGSYTNAEDILDTEFYYVQILKDSVLIRGNCTIEINSSLDGEDDTDFVYYAPCRFKLIFKLNDNGWGISDESELEIDTSILDK